MLEFILLFAVIVSIIAAIALIRGLINNAIVRAQAKKDGYEPPKKEPTPNPDWIWNEERKLWVHKSELEREKRNQHTAQSSTKTDGSYHYKGKDITDEWLRVTRNINPKPENKEKPTYTKPKYEPPKTNYVWESAEWKPKPPQSPREYRQEEPPKETNRTENKPQNLDSENQYEAKSILTYNERRNYKTLKEAADKKGYTVQLKPRMADIAGSRIKDRRDKQFWVNFNKISQKHVDFAILDENLRIIAIIELDDSSHDTPKAKERDAFKDSVLKDCGYKVIHTRYIWPDILDNI